MTTLKISNAINDISYYQDRAKEDLKELRNDLKLATLNDDDDAIIKFMADINKTEGYIKGMTDALRILNNIDNM